MTAPLLDQLRAAQEKLGKWRGLYAGWWFGTRRITDPQARAARDNFDRTIMLRCEVNALTRLLLDKRVFSDEEFTRQLLDELQHMDRELERQWPGIRTDDTGLSLKMPEAAETLTRAGFPP